MRRCVVQSVPIHGVAAAALMLVALGSTAVAAPAQDARSPRVFNICDLGGGKPDAPGNSQEALRRLLERRLRCQDVFVLTLEADLTSMAAEHGEELESISVATEALLSLTEDVNSFRAVISSQETGQPTLKSSLNDVLSGVDALSSALNDVGDDAQLANVDLQNILQKQQQTLQMMSNISKMLYDTASAIIRKIGG